jgi:hypothetical protein
MTSPTLSRACWLALLLALPSSAWEIPLALENPGKAGFSPYVSSGVPLLAGQAKEISDLRLAVKGADGELAAVPAQFRALARWWRGDGSIRWVLVDFATTDVPGDKKVVVLTDAKLIPPSPKAPVTVADKADEIVVSTGPATFTVGKKKFALLQSAVVDGQEMLDGSPDLGLVIDDTYGEKYYASEGTKSVEVLENGPVRVCVRVRGQHLARGGRGYSRGMYGYDVFMNFCAGSSSVSLDVIVCNNFQKSIGSPTFEDASLLLKLKGGAANYSLWGDKPAEGRLAAGESVCLYQDSNGADTWEACPGFGNMDTKGWSPLATKITNFRGYKVVRRAGGKEEELAAGNQARGLLHARNERGGVVVQTRNFWQQFPKAAEVGADGTIRIGLFPRECIVPHYLEDASAKGHEIFLHFHGAKAGAAPEALADAWELSARLRPAFAHMAAAGALCDLGPYSVFTQGLDKQPDNRTRANDARMLTDDELYGNAYGWQVFGERWRSNGGHSTHGARQPINEDCYLFRWYLTGSASWLAAGEARSRQFRDVRVYRVDEEDALLCKDWKTFNATHPREHGKAERSPTDAEAKKYQQGLWPRSPWEFPNREHTVLDLLYDRYLLFGDIRAFENMRVAAAHGVFYVIGNTTTDPTAWSFVNRDIGWSWRTFDRYWELTGDKRATERYQELIQTQLPMIGKPPLIAKGSKPADKNGLTRIWCHALTMGTLHTGDSRLIELLKTAAEGKEPATDYFDDLFAVLYHLTGEQKYKDAVLAKTDGGNKLLRVTGNGQHDYFPPAAHWLLNQPPKVNRATPNARTGE